jgi:hypothetical protein
MKLSSKILATQLGLVTGVLLFPYPKNQTGEYVGPSDYVDTDGLWNPPKAEFLVDGRREFYTTFKNQQEEFEKGQTYNISQIRSILGEYKTSFEPTSADLNR